MVSDMCWITGITASVFAKYIATAQDNNVPPTTLAAALIGAFTGTSPGSTEGGAGTINNNFGDGSLIGTAGFLYEDSSAPKAYLNLMFLPESQAINLVKDATFAYDQISSDATESVLNGTSDSPFDELRIENFEAPQNGYILVYVSNEGSLTDVYFDDLQIEITESPIVQVDDYYPFGLTFNSYQRVTATPNRWKFQGQEHIDDLGLNWDSFKWRNHDPAIGRFFNVDPLAEKYVYNSPYAFSENKVIAHIELEGLESVPITPLVNPSSIRINKNFYENFNEPQKGLNAIKTNKSYIKESAQKHGVSAQAISSVIFQEKSAGWRGDLSNSIAEVVKSDDNTLSLGLGEMQVGLAAELMGMDPENLSDEQRQQVKDALKDPEQSIDLISHNILDMEEFVGRELTVEEITYGHNAGKEALKTQIDEGKETSNRVSSRSAPYQEEISEIIEDKDKK